jgi:hypothetical protein
MPRHSRDVPEGGSVVGQVLDDLNRQNEVELLPEQPVLDV